MKKDSLAAARSKAGKWIRTWWKRILAAGIAALVLAAGLEWIQMETEPHQYEDRVTAATDWASLDFGGAEAEGCGIEGHTIAASDGGTIRFHQDKGHMNYICFFFNPAPEAEGLLKVYYAGEGEEFTEEKSYPLKFWAGQSKADMLIPEGDYTDIRIEVTGSVNIVNAEYAIASYDRVKLPGSYQKKRMVKAAVILFAVLMFLFAVHGWTRIRNLARRAAANLTKDKKSTLIHAGIFLLTTGGTYLLLRIYIPYAKVIELNRISNTFLVTVSLAAGCLFCFRETLAKKAEVFFLIFTLLIGWNFAFFAPVTSSVSWDDGYHYEEANIWSFLGERRLTYADIASLRPMPEQEFDTEKLDAWHEAQTEQYQIGAATSTGFGLQMKNFWNGFSGIGLFLGRALQLPFHLIWELGRFTGLLAYAVIGYFAIRRLKSGKMLLAVTLMIPENIFLAASYSYDPGVTAFLALGLAYMFAEWQEPEKKMTWWNAAVMLGAMYLGCVAKAIYFPVLLFPMFLPRSKFESPRQHKAFLGLTAGVILILILSFAMPMLTGSADSSTDTRGGEDVSAAGQIAFILANPLKYAETLYFYLKSFLHPDNIMQYATFFAYKGTAPNYNLYLIALAVAAFTDKSEYDDPFARKGWRRILFLLILAGTAGLVATSMYVAFTPVGSGTVNGCQPRYMLPLFYPALMMFGFSGTHNRANRKYYNGLLFALAGYVGFASVFLQFITLYS